MIVVVHRFDWVHFYGSVEAPNTSKCEDVKKYKTIILSLFDDLALYVCCNQVRVIYSLPITFLYLLGSVILSNEKISDKLCNI